MHASRKPPQLWVNWLLCASAGVALFGLILVLAPGLGRQGFSLLVYGNADRLTSFGTEPARYIALAHAVLGAVMFGWGTALVLIVRALLASGSMLGWRIIAFSVCAWFAPDTAYSLWSGYWQNAILNCSFALLFFVPLAATYRSCHVRGAQSFHRADKPPPA